MPDSSYALSVIDGSRRTLDAALLRIVLAGLACVYTVGLKGYLLPYRSGLRRQVRLSAPVVSIGNLTVGGTGKTSMTRWVCELLKRNGLTSAVLSRGYHGQNEFGAAVVSTPDAVLMDAAAAGDEAHMLARHLPGTPVIVGKDRRVTGAMAIREFRPDVVVLDDGMQFYQLHRDLDIVLLNAACPFDNEWTLPRGLLREPPDHLRRAGCIILTNTQVASPDELASLRSRATRLSRGKPVFTAWYEPTGLADLAGATAGEVGWLAGRKVVTFCALGSPATFEETVRKQGADIVGRSRMPDHASPTDAEIAELLRMARSAGAEAIIVSEKDAVKMRPCTDLPVMALTVDLTIDDAEGLGKIVLSAVDAARSGGCV